MRTLGRLRTSRRALALGGLIALAPACGDDGADVDGTGEAGTGTEAATSTGTPSATSTSGTAQSSGSGQGGSSQGGAGQGGSGQGGSGQGGSGQGGSGQGGSGQGGAGQGGSGQGGAGQGGSGQGGSGQGGSGQGGAGGGVCTVECDDGLFCNGVEVCDPPNGDPITGCAASSGSPCDDGIACTVEVCDETEDACTTTLDDAVCDNGAGCDGTETCDAVLGCVDGAPVDCDDAIACTADFCDVGTGECNHVAMDTLCGDDLFCNGVETCSVADGGCVDGDAPTCDDGLACTQDSCDDDEGACSFVPSNAACQDGNACNGAETCDADVGCVGGTPLTCNDGVACTADSCNPGTGCVYAANDSVCDDGLGCNGEETCSPTLGCRAGAPVVCPGDGIACTIETCDEDDLSCSSVPTNGECDAGEFCIVAQGGCAAGAPCDDAGDCTDDDACNGIELCIAGLCEPGEPVDCDDGTGCTVDSCDPDTGACDSIPNDDLCDDGLACDGVEICDADDGCREGTPVVCTDNVACTINRCSEPTGECETIPNHALCSDGEVCNGAEQCTPNGCAAGAPLVCPGDGIGCTVEACVPGLGCRSVPNDDLCPCTQSCDPDNGGCGNFCVVAECQGKVYECGDCVDNDGDCRVDSDDSMCLGACDNTEDSFYGGIPGQNNAPCKHECYFDQDTGSGNDDCHWSHKCDPLEVGPAFPPEGSQCRYNPNTSIPGYSGSCSTAFTTQSDTCDDYCGPLTPNGCDCFGCCEIEGAPTPVWLGSEVDGDGSCDLDNLDDPALCKPCTQVQACLNTCEDCEICIGQTELPANCLEQTCPAGRQKCGLPGQDACPASQYCVTGCCQPVAE